MQLENNYYRIVGKRITDGQALFRIAFLPDCDVYRGHFPGNAVCPGACHIEMLKKCVETLVGKPLFIRTIKQCRFTAIASPLVCPQADLTVVCIPVSDGVAVEARLTDGEKVYMDYRGKMAFDV